jgi:isoquinoline 1-oxidoreductase subunit alpha
MGRRKLMQEWRMAFVINVNGTRHSVDVDGDTSVLWVLRDVLGLSGTKCGCGAGLCGACTVHIDGAPTRSCIITTIDSVGNSQITTIEAIGRTVMGAKFKKHGSISRSFNAATVKPARSCPPWLC